MKLGYFTMPVHPPARSYVETLKEDREAFILADRLGFAEGYCGEHLTDTAENIPNSMMFIATLLGVTSQMKVGTAVVNLPYSHPVVVASNAAMLDNLFEGRFILGIGAGVLPSDAEALQLLEADRNAMFAEAIDHILALWAGTPPIDLKGKYWTISTVKTRWPEIGLGDIVKPYQKPHPPIAGTATTADSGGLIALGRRGWWPISSHFLHPNGLKQPMGELCPGLRRRRAPGRPRQLARCALDLRRRGRQGGARLWRRRSRKPLSFLHAPADREAEKGGARCSRSSPIPTCRTRRSPTITSSTTS